MRDLHAQIRTNSRRFARSESEAFMVSGRLGSRDMSIQESCSILTFLKPVFDIGAVAQPLQPFLKSCISFTRADSLTRRLPLSLLADILGAALNNLDQVPAKWRLDRLTDFPGLSALMA